jgi:hypothetical protein
LAIYRSASITAPLLATRVFIPFSSTLIFTRVGFFVF